MGMPLITAVGLKKQFDDVVVLHGLDLEVAPNEMVAIVGPSGSGKTTLLQLLGCLDTPDEGVLTFLHHPYPTQEKERVAFRRHSVGFVFQFHHLLSDFSALENVAMPAWIAGEDKEGALDKAKKLLSHFDLGNRLHHIPAKLSGGEQQRVAVARALINRPQLLLADEPSGNLDSANAAHLHELLMAVKKEYGTAVVAVTHSEALAASADRVLHLHQGQWKRSNP